MAEAEGVHQALGLTMIKAIITSMRPRQWTKNLIIYFAFLFTIGQAWSLEELYEATRLLARITVAFAIFCLITSAVYLLNDVLDAEKDRRHPKKRYRPIAAGVLAPVLALAMALAMAVGGVALALVLEPLYALVTLIYLAMMIAYSIYLKRLVIVDIMVISGGFVLRAVAGAVVLDVTISPWLYICTTLGALFLGFAKRLNEIVLARFAQLCAAGVEGHQFAVGRSDIEAKQGNRGHLAHGVNRVALQSPALRTLPEAQD